MLMDYHLATENSWLLLLLLIFFFFFAFFFLEHFGLQIYHPSQTNCFEFILDWIGCIGANKSNAINSMVA